MEQGFEPQSPKSPIFRIYGFKFTYSSVDMEAYLDLETLMAGNIR